MDDVELQLITDACRSLIVPDAVGIELPRQVPDWRRLPILARRHRVQALLWKGLQPVRDRIPEPIAAILRQDAEAVVGANLQIAVESARLLRQFQSAGVDVLFLKGLALAALSYADPYLKMGWDIDLLVSPQEIGEAGRLLRKAGYSLIVPHSASDRQLSDWHEANKESVWASADGQFHVDLHSRLSDNPAMLAGVGLKSPRQMASVADGIELPTLGPEELFAYLCVHGASSAWFRLKWPMDLAAMLSRRFDVQIENLYRRSQELGAGRAAGQGLLLVHHLFGIELDAGLQAQLNEDRWSRRLAAAALRELASVEDPTERPLGTSMIHLTQLVMMPGMRFAVSEARRQLQAIASRNRA